MLKLDLVIYHICEIKLHVLALVMQRTDREANPNRVVNTEKFTQK